MPPPACPDHHGALLISARVIASERANYLKEPHFRIPGTEFGPFDAAVYSNCHYLVTNAAAGLFTATVKFPLASNRPGITEIHGCRRHFHQERPRLFCLGAAEPPPTRSRGGPQKPVTDGCASNECELSARRRDCPNKETTDE